MFLTAYVTIKTKRIYPSDRVATNINVQMRAYLHHLFAANEILSAILCSIHNVHFYEQLVQTARKAILDGHYDAWRGQFLAAYAGGTAPGED